MPLIFNNNSEKLANFLRFLMPEVNKPAIINITPWPIAKRNNIIIAAKRFFPIAAKVIMPANIGVEHGVPARANATPNKIGYTNSELVLFVGIALIITGISKSNKFVNFNPITKSNEAITRVKYAPKAEAKTLPVTAQIIPIIVKTIAVPKIKKQSWTNVLNGVSLEYPPTYPTISGNIASEQGEIEARIPPKNDAKNIKAQTPTLFVPEEKICTKLSIN